MVAIGQLLDRRYLITQILGTGGFGQTYLAEDTKRSGSPDCVVKQLWLSHSSPHTVQTAHRLFAKEAEVLAKLGQHDQIPRLLAYFEEDHQFYLVEEYILGQSLAEEIIPGRSLNETQVIILLTQILEILAFVHSHRAIHRDIKPANLIKRIDNKIVLIDFGAVKEISSQLHQGQISLTVAIGTPPYMPIEQLQGHPRYNSDIYALGIIGIQALTGLSTDHLSKNKILLNSNNSNIGGISWRNGFKVSSRLADVLDKMVHFDFRKRYQSAKEVLAELETITNSNLTPNTQHQQQRTFLPSTFNSIPIGSHIGLLNFR
jgi:serine/threonine protein kinase